MSRPMMMTDQEMGQRFFDGNANALRDMIKDNWERAQGEVDHHAKDMRSAHHFGADIVLDRAAKLAYAIYYHGCWNALVMEVGIWFSSDNTNTQSLVTDIRKHLASLYRSMPYAKDEHEERALDQHAQECQRMIKMFEGVE